MAHFSDLFETRGIHSVQVIRDDARTSLQQKLNPKRPSTSRHPSFPASSSQRLFPPPNRPSRKESDEDLHVMYFSDLFETKGIHSVQVIRDDARTSLQQKLNPKRPSTSRHPSFPASSSKRLFPPPNRPSRKESDEDLHSMSRWNSN